MKKKLLNRLMARFRKNGIMAGLMAATGSELAGKRWIFIVGCYNSGTTLLNQILSAHPDISGMSDEGVMLTDVLPRPEDFGWRRMWWKCEDKMGIDPARGASVARRVRRHWSHFVDRAKPCILEKSIANTTRIPFLEENFGNPYFIHIVRNGYAVAEGILRKAPVMPRNPLGTSNYPIDYCITQWKRSIEVVSRDQQHVRHWIEIRYEDLVADPVDTTGRVLAFLGLKPFDKAFFERRFLVHQRAANIVNMNDESLSRLTGHQKDVIKRIAGDELNRHGYAILPA